MILLVIVVALVARRLSVEEVPATGTLCLVDAIIPRIVLLTTVTNFESVEQVLTVLDSLTHLRVETARGLTPIVDFAIVILTRSQYPQSILHPGSRSFKSEILTLHLLSQLPECSSVRWQGFQIL